MQNYHKIDVAEFKHRFVKESKSYTAYQRALSQTQFSSSFE